jgi:acetyl esterase/lipase
MTSRVSVLVGLLVAALGALWWVQEPAPVERTPALVGADAHLDVEYGNHEFQRLDVYTPDSPGPHPTIVWLHPGGWIAGDKAASMPVWEWTERGYAVVSINYRYAIHPHTVADSVDDALAAVQHVLDRSGEWDLDASRVGVYGFSAGGHLAAMIAHEQLDVAAVAIAGAPTDFTALLDPDVRFFDGRTGAAVVAAARDLLGCQERIDTCHGLAVSASPAQLSGDSVDFLIVHGALDHIVDVDQAYRLHHHLVASGHTPELVIVEDGGHEPLVDEAGIAEFFDERLLS